jgi:hypothetical protein
MVLIAALVAWTEEREGFNDFKRLASVLISLFTEKSALNQPGIETRRPQFGQRMRGVNMGLCQILAEFL